MAPGPTSQKDGLLEHPAEAFDYYQSRNTDLVICEEKHMGSRAVFVIARSREAALQRFGITNDAAGVAYTRTGRRFFTDSETEHEVIERLRNAIAKTHGWEWACIDAEVMPWSAKGAGLIATHYAPVAAAARMGLAEATRYLSQAQERDGAHAELLARYQAKREMAEGYDQAYKHYSWPVNGVDDLKIAPFHVLANEEGVHADKSHAWHLAELDLLADSEPILTRTERIVVNTTNAEGRASNAVVDGAHRHRRGGHGGKAPGIHRTRERPTDSAGPEVSRTGVPANHLRTRIHRAGAARAARRSNTGKLRLSLQEFALGIEALRRFCEHEPLRKVHQAVFGVLALESEPVDPRL